MEVPPLGCRCVARRCTTMARRYRAAMRLAGPPWGSHAALVPGLMPHSGASHALGSAVGLTQPRGPQLSPPVPRGRRRLGWGPQGGGGGATTKGPDATTPTPLSVKTQGALFLLHPAPSRGASMKWGGGGGHPPLAERGVGGGRCLSSGGVEGMY